MKIEKGIPIPPPSRPRRYSTDLYPELRDMEVGDSCWFPGAYYPARQDPEYKMARAEYNKLCSALNRERGQGRTIVTRKLEEDGELGTRVWRTA